MPTGAEDVVSFPRFTGRVACGEVGPTGPQGPSDFSGWEIVTSSLKNPLGFDEMDQTTECPDGKVTTGGGGYIEMTTQEGSGEKGWLIRTSRPIDNGTAWEVKARDDSLATFGTFVLTVYAICATPS